MSAEEKDQKELCLPEDTLVGFADSAIENMDWVLEQCRALEGTGLDMSEIKQRAQRTKRKVQAARRLYGV
jgi:hypothetical protein